MVGYIQPKYVHLVRKAVFTMNISISSGKFLSDCNFLKTRCSAAVDENIIINLYTLKASQLIIFDENWKAST